MISVLIVEDDAQKFGRIQAVLVGNGVRTERIGHALCAAEAVRLIRTNRYDLMLLDINLPRVLGEAPVRGGGMDVLRHMERDEEILRPSYIIGTTAYEDLVGEFGPGFEDQLWSIIHYSEGSDRWTSQLIGKLDYIHAAKKSRRFSDGITFGCDLAIVTALADVEHAAVLNLPCDWLPLRLMHDETRYVTGTFQSTDGVDRTVVAGSAPRMGMPAAAILSSKIIQQFRPRVLVMTGICAGRSGRINIGDVIMADPSWDCGSGKIEAGDNGPRFLPDPHQLDLDPDDAELLKELARDEALLAVIKGDFEGAKPDHPLCAKVGPLTSGSAVITDPTTFEALIPQHRKLLGLEMEAYGVMAAGRGNGRPRPTVLVAKAVSDFADEKKADDFQAYAAHASARVALEAARRLLAGSPAISRI